MDLLAATEQQPHARAALAAAVSADGKPSHAYLFAGPSGTGKRTVARALAASLLAQGASDPEDVAGRVARGSHPDLTWVKPSGAGEMRAADIAEPVVQAVSQRPFEARWRVFVLEDVETMNDQAANRMLKTLEEPPSYVCLILLSKRAGDLPPTILSRCQFVRFDAPAIDVLAQRVAKRSSASDETAEACARLSLGESNDAIFLASRDGVAMRDACERLARHLLHGQLGPAPISALSRPAEARGAVAAAATTKAAEELADQLPEKEGKRAIREAVDDAKRSSRRARTAALDLSLQLCGLWFRDVAALALGAPQHVHHVDRLAELHSDAAAQTSPEKVMGCIEITDQARRALRRNASEELQLEAMAVRLRQQLA